ncbi:MAG: hypothetical protein HQL28_07260 [Candidatus Omnitrophica bacterium]|nr:hypothetical protein [Candidatus Omnitrophota bacterium]
MSLKLSYAIILGFGLSVAASVTASAGEGLDNLIQVGKSMESGQKALADETSVFNAVKAAVETGAIKPGQTQDEIRTKYGQPSTFLTKPNGRSKWVYKPGYGDYFSGTKVYLLFDAGKKLIESSVITQKKEKK